MRHRSVVLAMVGLGGAVGFGCVGILGDFQTATGVGPGQDGGVDGTAQGDGSVTSDALAEGSTGDDSGDAGDAGLDAAAYFLNCDGFKNTNPVVIDSLDQNTASQGRSFQDRLHVATISDNELAVVTRRGASNGFSYYTVMKQSPNNSGRVDQPIGDQYLDFRRGAGANDLMTSHYTPLGSALNVTVVPDTDGPGAQLPPPFPLTGALGYSQNLSGTFIEFTPSNDYYFAYSSQAQDGGTGLYVGRARADAGTPALGAAPVYHGASPILIHTGTQVRAIMSSDPSQDAGALQYTFADDGTANGNAAPRSLSGAKLGLALDAIPTGTGRVNLAFGEFDPTSPTALLTLRVGSIEATKLDTFMVPDLPLGPAFGDTSLFPIDQGESKWAGDEWIMIGKGSPATFPGVNMVWIDAGGHLRAQAIGANALLKDRPNTVTRVGISAGQRIGIRYVTWNIVWVETVHGVAGTVDYDVMYTNEVICH